MGDVQAAPVTPVQPPGDTLLVSEVFGPTVQGEGPSAGRRCGFVRFGLCNLDCTWCDTPYTWDWSGKNGDPQDRDALLHVKPADLAVQVLAMGVTRLVVTGGEPLIQQRRLAPFLEVVRGHVEVEVETNGTMLPDPAMLELVNQWNVSPKLPHSGVPEYRAWKSAVLRVLTTRGQSCAVKVVCRDADDVALTARLCADIGVPAHMVWVMPEGRCGADLDATLAVIASPAIDAGFNVTTRLHVHAWGDRRGV